MYIVGRKNKIIEQLGFKDSEGKVSLVLDIEINVDEIIADFAKAYNNALNAQKEIEALKIDEPDGTKELSAEYVDKSEKAKQLYGDAIILMFNLIFGKENTDKILEFFEDRYIEMSDEIFPFIIGIVLPAIDKANIEQEERLKNNYRSVKKKRFIRK